MSGLDLLSEFIDASLFLHDDWNPVNGIEDWDQYDTNPFLLGASACVVGTLAGFGDDYIAYLDTLGCVPRTVIVPDGAPASSTLTERFAVDSYALASAKAERKEVLSAFYHYQAAELDHVACHLGAVIAPARAAFELGDDRVRSTLALKEAGIPTPLSEVCADREGVMDFARFASRRNYEKIVLKSGSRSSSQMSTHDGQKPSGHLRYPLLAEVVEQTICSPVAQSIHWRSSSVPLFVLEQRVANFRHMGNLSGGELPRSVALRCGEYGLRLAELLPDYVGVLGIDLILTADGRLLVVDVNPRFNSSTYPLFFVERMARRAGRALQCAYSVLSVRNVSSLTDIFKLEGFRTLMFLEETARGLVFFNPVRADVSGGLRSISIVSIGATLSECAGIEEEAKAELWKNGILGAEE